MYKRYIGIFLIIAVSALIFGIRYLYSNIFVIILWLENYIRERQFLGVLIFIGLAAIHQCFRRSAASLGAGSGNALG